ncbi:C25 family cysteine peptidase [Lysobacter sp. TAF61]|uniref:C25 family cysteine peptidase n=1 Tax=Lysobacter sp. TAF61 TaxID=3233072 RepID=UPI003F98C36A
MSTEPTGFNGIDATTGEYLQTPSVEQISRAARGEPAEPVVERDVLVAKQHAMAPTFGVPFGVDPADLAQTGWGIVPAHDALPEVLDALKPLCDLRNAQAGARYKAFTGPAAYRPDDRARTWLARQGAALGLPQIDKVPYYLLIVGGPESIPFRFQYELGINYAVGRLHFDSIDGYRNYAASVIASEQRSPQPGPRRASFFAVNNDDDRATKLSSQMLVAPLADKLATRQPQWQLERILAAEATKARLGACLQSAPSIVFTASHGMGFPLGDARQQRHQGALLCQDWPGPIRHRGAIPEAFYFSGDDVSDSADLSGTIAFHFACYGAGTPQRDDYAPAGTVPATIASAPFLAHLPQRLAGKPDGGALAVIGHVERAWTYSFSWPGVGAQTSTFEECLHALMSGVRVGAAMDAFAMKHADLAVTLNGELDAIKYGAAVDDYTLAGLWTAHHDARSYVVIGDPAVRLSV